MSLSYTPRMSPTESSKSNFYACSSTIVDLMLLSPPTPSTDTCTAFDAYDNPFLDHSQRSELTYSPDPSFERFHAFKNSHSCLKSTSSAQLQPIAAITASSPDNSYALTTFAFTPSSRSTPYPNFQTPSMQDLLPPLLSPMFSLNSGDIYSQSQSLALYPPTPTRTVDASALIYPSVSESPVVRRSLGDITPPYRRQKINSPVQPLYFTDFTTVSYSQDFISVPYLTESTTDMVSVTETQQSSPPVLQERGTPFIDRLRRNSLFKHPSSSPSSISSPGVFLASPFTAQTHGLGLSVMQDTSSASVLNNSGSSPATKEPYSSDILFMHLFNASPLSECSLDTPSSHVSRLLEIVDQEDRQHRMNTRSTKNIAFQQKLPVLSKHSSKKRRRDLDDADDDIEDATIDECSNSFRKKMKKNLPDTLERDLNGTLDVNHSAFTPKHSIHSLTTSFAYQSTQPSLSPLREVFSWPAVKKAREDPTKLNLPQRTFPSHVPIHPDFPRLYRQFPIISHYYPEDSDTSVLWDMSTHNPPPSAQIKQPRNAYDLYTPRFTKGIGRTKEGICPICFESKERGGEDRLEWLSMKFSAYKFYHMHYFHGISSYTGLPFSPPIEFRIVKRRQVEIRKRERQEMMQGRCHHCDEWVPVEGVKDAELKIRELYWWKHAVTCHRSSTIPGERDIYIHDDVFDKLKAYERLTSAKSEEMEC